MATDRPDESRIQPEEVGMTKEPVRQGGRIALRILGRFAVVVVTTLVGLISGLAVGGYLGASTAAAAPMPARPSLGMESAGFIPAILIAIHLLMGGVVGAFGGLVTGTIWAILWPVDRRDG
jgi:hypothetical protein